MAKATRSRGYLPHLETQKPIFFVTFRLADSLPQSLLAQVRAERSAIQQARHGGVIVPADRARLTALKALMQRAERCLDSGLGACYMSDTRVARIVADALRFFAGKRYRLFAWCVMPNHVHVVFSPLENHGLGSIVHSWKSFTAKAANRLLGRTGNFWQREYFDHLVRSEASLVKVVEYIRRNPERAGLKDWPFVEVLP